MARPFVIAFLGRSGSTWLCELLSGHPQIACDFEPFSLRRADGRVQRRQPNVSDSLAYLEAMAARPEVVAGFKFQFPHQPDFYPEVPAWFITHREVARCIRLRRQNLLKVAVSRQNQLRKRALLAVRGLPMRSNLAVGPLDLDTDAALSYMAEVRSRQAKLDAFQARFDSVLSVEYEALLSRLLVELWRITLLRRRAVRRRAL